MKGGAEIVEKSFIKGATILGLAGLVCKILGAIYRIPYQNITGNEGMYVYQQVYPLFSTLIILATAGFPLAISKVVSERVAVGDEVGAKQVYYVSSMGLLITGVFFFSLLFFGAPWFAQWMGNEAMLTLPIETVSFALLVIPVMAAARGYFQGYQDMMPTAVSQVIEQFVRVFTILILSYLMITLGYGPVYAGAGAVFGSFTGAVAGFIVLLVYMRKKGVERTAGAGVKIRQPLKRKREVLKEVFLIAFPICLGSLVLPLYQLVDSFTVANILEQEKGEAFAIAQKGIYDRGQPLIQFASFFAAAISLSLVPSIADLRARGEVEKAEKRARLALRVTWMLGLPASIGLFMIAEPVNVMLFEDSAGSTALAILAFSAFFSTLGITSVGVLQGFGKLYLPVLFLFLGSILKIGLNYNLIPHLGIEGAAWASVMAYALSTYLTLRACLQQFTGKMGNKGAQIWGSVLTILLLVVSTKGVLEMLRLGFGEAHGRVSMTFISLVTVIVGVLVYIFALFRFHLISDEDLEQLPKLQSMVHKFRWLRR
ncbi:polysaccharide biosynthesis protein [Thermoactinomyces sp. DSM 45892]|uniref:putative polysaccharide biosynthesis protein n=1 Tax=Thermoactinomyces sp. DSM 45892 TaxID=1882753 RepID=UPI000896DEF6|nr:polysaccharide biosynthesis protein [Thermoactinomyces sp. DSM 45892]SDY94962.1 polysaccharide transporter, PST family [Thermoactinomyces sp. DSM 45892]